MTAWGGSKAYQNRWNNKIKGRKKRAWGYQKKKTNYENHSPEAKWFANGACILGGGVENMAYYGVDNSLGF